MRDKENWTEFHELLYALALNFRPVRALEIGSGRGHSAGAVSWGQIDANVKPNVVSIEADRELFKECKATCYKVTFLCLVSPGCLVEVGKSFGPFDFLVLDQTEKGLYQKEFEALKPFLASECVVVAHDTAFCHGGDNFRHWFINQKNVRYIEFKTLPGTLVGIYRRN